MAQSKEVKTAGGIEISPELAPMVNPMIETLIFLDYEKQRPPTEIERKFLVSELPVDLDPETGESILQAYLQINDDREVRIRSRADKEYTLTIKEGNGLERVEREMPISSRQFEIFWEASEAHIEKVRFKLQHHETVMELDVYLDELEGLVVVEAEFDSLEKAGAFSPPAWCGAEITFDKAYKNQQLALVGAPVPDMIQANRSAPDIFVDHILESGIQELVGLVDKKRSEITDRPLMVLVAGRTSSGKTSAVTNNLVSRFGADHIKVLSTDDYFIGSQRMAELQDQGHQEINWDHPDYVDFKRLERDLDALRSGESIEKPIFNFKTGEPDSNEAFDPAAIIIVEGIYALHERVRDRGDVAAFVDISLHGSLIRRLLRDIQRTPFGPDVILHHYLDIVEPMYQEHVRPTRDTADVVLVNEYHPRNEAGRAGVNENQIKFVGHPSEKQLREAGARRLGQVEQIDSYYLPHDGKVYEDEEVIRIRQEGEQLIFTYKGPDMASSVRTRPVFEFPIGTEDAQMFLERYGNKVKTIAKKRTLYQLDSVIVALDEVNASASSDQVVQALGSFTEIRGNFGENVPDILSKAANSLGYRLEDGITTPYVVMMDES